ncbi:MAG: response regulator [Deltaproteobacteria bacterium]|nr:response regulator [Deltaproteobacteria bacterium]
MTQHQNKATIQESPTILIIDDDPGTCETLTYILKGKGYLPSSFSNGKDAVKAVQDGFVNLALIDLKLPDMSGLDVLEEINKLSPDTEAIIITGHASLKTAVQAMHDAAFSYVTKPIDMDHLLAIVARALERQKLQVDRKRAEEALRESEDKLAGIVGSVTDHMSMMDEKHNIVWANDIAKSLFGSDLLGKKCYAAYHGRSKVCEPCIVTKCFKDGKTHHYEPEVVAANGSQMTFWCTASVATRYEGGRPKTVLEISRDITERKQLEAQLFKAQKMEAIGTLAGGIAHDFNNILAVIQGDAQLISMDLDPANPHYEMVKEIENRVKAGANLTKQLLGFARGGKYEIKPIDLNAVVRESSTTFGRTKKEIAIHRKLRKDLPPIEADTGQIEQVLMNLYVNAGATLCYRYRCRHG